MVAMAVAVAVIMFVVVVVPVSVVGAVSRLSTQRRLARDEFEFCVKVLFMSPSTSWG